MTSGAIFWLVVFGISAFLFFAVALVVMARGMADLRDLLGGSVRGRRER
jgi:hypothetical protein